MKAQWETASVGDVCEILDNRRKPVTKKDRRPGEFPYYGATGVVDYVDQFIFDEPLVLVGEDGAKWGSGEGTAFAVSGRCWVNNHAHVLRPIRTKLIDDWLVYYLVHEDLTPFVSGLTVPKLNQGNLREIPLPLPPLDEQRRIVAILDKAFEGIATARANAERNLQNARELFDNALQSLLNSGGIDRTQRSMADVCDIRSKLVDPREVQYLDLPHVGAGNIETKTGALLNVLTARQEQLISGKFLFDESMVLYSKIRPYLMKVVRPDFSGLCSADIYPLSPKAGVIVRDYLYYLLLSPAFTEYAITGSARAGMPKVNREHLFAYEFTLPSIQEQAQIAARLDVLAEETQGLIAVYERKLAALDELKKSLLYQAFSGQL